MDAGLEDSAPSLTHRIVLLAVTELTVRGETPAHSGTVRSASIRLLEAVENDPLGNLAESDTVRALNELEAAGVVAAVDLAESSPVGKGRPGYELAVESDALLAELGEDDRVRALVETVQEATDR